ncbi:MAG: 2-C-methyl-D-erythritol 4-phosphate cytidylyltransferase [Lachnospirales bacterium]
MKNSVIICAAGVGKRMKSKVAKQYILLNDRPILSYTIEAFEKSKDICEIIIVTGKEDIDFVKNEIVDKFGFKKVKSITAGGAERQHSVYNGLKAVSKDCDIVLVHDGVRPFITEENIHNIIEETKIYNACCLGVKVKDTIKICDENGYINETPKRDKLWAAHTPQSFRYDIIMKAYESAFSEGILGTDDSMLVERIGVKVKMVEGSYNNIKITTPEDLYMGENILKNIK